MYNVFRKKNQMIHIDINDQCASCYKLSWYMKSFLTLLLCIIVLRLSTIVRLSFVTHSHKTHRKSPEHFLRYRLINIIFKITINMITINMGELFREYDK